MRRPLCTVGFTLLFSLLCLNFFGSRVLAVCVFAGSAVLFALSLIIKKLRQVTFVPTVFVSVAVACLLFSFSVKTYTDTVSLCGENLAVSGTVSENPEFSHGNGRYYCIVSLDEISGVKAKGKIRLSFSETYDEISHHDFEIGDKVSFVGTVYGTGENSENIQNYFKSKGIYLGAYGIRNLKIEKPDTRGMYYYASLVRSKAIDVILRHFGGDTAGLMIAVLTGDKSYVSDELYTASKLSGVVHLMAVSGLHLSVWVFFVGALLERKGRKSSFAYALMMLCVIFMMNFASFTGSVRRAGFMTLLYLLGKIVGQDSDPLNSLGFSLTVILLASPYSVYDVGFMLSLFSTLGILVMAFPISDSILKNVRVKHEETWYFKLAQSVLDTITVSIAVTVFTFPIMYSYFGYISSVSAVTNLLILFVCMPLVVLTGIFTLTSAVPILSAIVGVLCKYISLYIIRVVTFMGNLSFAKVTLDMEFLRCWTVIACISVFAIVMLKRRKPALKAILSAFIAVTFAVGFCTESYINYGSYKITNPDAGGNCIIVSCAGRGVIVGLSGDYYLQSNILDTVERRNLKIDAIIPDENADRLTLSYLENELGARVIEADCNISLFGIVEIAKQGGLVTAKGNGKTALLLNEENLQETENYDIIYSTCKKGETIIRRKR